MPQHQLKNFSDLAFIQKVDKPRFMAQLLLPYADYFNANGLDVTKLKNGDGHDRQLLEVFTKADEDMPPKLLESLYVLDDLADENGHDRILTEAERLGLDLNGIVGQDLSPGEFAIAVHQAHPRVLTVCHDKTLYRKVKNFEEYQTPGERRLPLKTAKAKAPAMEKEMAPWFESKNRSRACEIYVYEERHELKFQITHGRPFRTDPSFDKKLERSRVAYRPQKHDTVVYDTRYGVLKVSAQTSAEKELYRRTFGKFLFGDEDHFPEGELYTLKPLRSGKAALAPVAGIDSVRLTEVWIALDDDQSFTQVSRAYSLIEAAAKHGQPNLQQGKLVRAAMMVKYKSGGRPRKLELRPPHVAIFDRDRDGEVAEAFLKANGFLKVGEQ